MKKVFLILLTVFVVLGFSACDEGSGENYYIKFIYDGTNYNLTEDTGNIPEPHLVIDNSTGPEGISYAMYIACSTTDVEVSFEITTDLYNAFANSTELGEAFIQGSALNSGDAIAVTSYDITGLALTEDDAGEVTGVAEGTFTASGVTEAEFRVKVVDVSILSVK